MCGIMAVIGENAVNDVLYGLKILEYRGYDSCGISILKNNDIRTFKSVGYIENLNYVKEFNSETTLAIGHTRWATNGKVNLENSHPHESPSGKFTVVHNGIIENYKELKDKYLSNVKFKSETDTEIIVQLMDYYLENNNVWETFQKVTSIIQGSFAIVLISKVDNKMYFARHISPLVISKTNGRYLLSSDINGFKDKSEVYFVEDNYLGYIDTEINLFNNKREKICIDWIDYSSENENIGKDKFQHYMNKEIYEIPNSLRKSYKTFLNSKFQIPRIINHVLIVGCGTSYHSGLLGCKYIEKYAGIKTECLVASEFIYNNYIITENTLAIFISQSGETADTLTALKKAKNNGMFTLAITNVIGSTITRVADAYIYENVGAEICVASTKAYTSQVFILLMLSNVLLNNIKGNYLVTAESDNIVIYEASKTLNYLCIENNEFEQLFSVNISIIESQVDLIINELDKLNNIYLIGKDFDYITAMEGALKIKEVSYIFTDAYPCGELKHGTLALIESGCRVISIMTNEQLFNKNLNSMHEIVARGGECIVISQETNFHLSDKFKQIFVPNLKDIFMPIISIIPLDLIAYKLSISKGYNPDKPRNLAKSVTVE